MADVGALPLKVGVVGCGGVAQVVHLPILKKMPDVDVVALCDVDVRKATIVANRFGVKKIFGDIEEMFRQCTLDAVFILTPSNMHLPMSLIALKNGAHIFIERPGARNTKEAQRLAAAAQRSQRHVMVGMHTRFREDMQAVKKYLDQKTFGEIFFIKAEWLQAKFQSIKQPWLLNKRVSGGGVLLDLGIQLVDTSWWLTGKPKIESVKAYSQQINSTLEVEDFCSFYLKFSNNLKMAFHASWNFPIAKDRFHAEIFGAKGSVNLNPFHLEKIHNGKSQNITPTGIERRAPILFKQAYADEIQHFIDFLVGKAKYLESSITDAVHIHSIIDAIYASLKTNREITL